MTEEVEKLKANLEDISDFAGNFISILELKQVKVGIEEIKDHTMDRNVKDEQLAVDVQLGSSSKPAILL